MTQPIYLKDYTPPPFFIEQVQLAFELSEEITVVDAKLKIIRNAKNSISPLRLDGESLSLQHLEMDGHPLPASAYHCHDNYLEISNAPDHFTLRIVTHIKPQENTALSGLYRSQGTFCTQCEAQGFRRITYFIDRPDVMSIYTVSITADKNRYPVLLSNGNLIKQEILPNNQHRVIWQDPFKKPAYLFALVAGNLAQVEDSFTTRSGRTVQLYIYVEKGNEDKCEHALQALKKAMAWDEKTYNREYDLDRYMIVAVSDFNMGAMENKGLNIFNDRYVLARPDVATDTDLKNVDIVIAHEYFHNWTGNRITCRDWFQLSLKEGLTVFREQQFTADVHPALPARIDEVQYIKTQQFAEDAGPLAHPVQPDSYIEINNFYTATVYNKGAEVIRMLETLLTPTGFKRGMAHYFSRYDGQAITIEDFISAMEEANETHLTQFRLWYHQAGTPVLRIKTHFDSTQKTYTVSIEQTCPPTPDQPHKKPFHIPFTMGLLHPDGHDFPNITRQELKHRKEELIFFHITEKPIPSFLRNFSAPVKIEYDYTLSELCFLMAHDSDGLNRWQASQLMWEKQITAFIQQKQTEIYPELRQAIETVLQDHALDNALKAKMITLPSLSYLAEQYTIVDIHAIYHARTLLRKIVSEKFHALFVANWEILSTSEHYSFNAAQIGKRQLKNAILNWLIWHESPILFDHLYNLYESVDNMTDRLMLLAALSQQDTLLQKKIQDHFYQQWQHESLVIDKWLSIQASAECADTFEKVQQLLKHPVYQAQNPNKIRALIGSFCQVGQIHFHHTSGEGYHFLTTQVEKIDAFNPQVAARLLTPLSHFKKYAAPYRAAMENALKALATQQHLSKDVSEVVNKFLAPETLKG